MDQILYTLLKSKQKKIYSSWIIKKEENISLDN